MPLLVPKTLKVVRKMWQSTLIQLNVRWSYQSLETKTKDPYISGVLKRFFFGNDTK